MKINLIKGDITKVTTDAIVNAANNSLMGGGGVDGAIHKAGGSAILEECILIKRMKGGCETGHAVVTSAGKLPSKYVIHTVGPVWNGGACQEPEKLASCYKNSLKIAKSMGLKSIAFPNISTGIYGFPKMQAAKIAIKTVKSCFQDAIHEILFVCYDEENYNIYRKYLPQTTEQRMQTSFNYLNI